MGNLDRDWFGALRSSVGACGLAGGQEKQRLGSWVVRWEACGKDYLQTAAVSQYQLNGTESPTSQSSKRKATRFALALARHVKAGLALPHSLQGCRSAPGEEPFPFSWTAHDCLISGSDRWSFALRRLALRTEPERWWSRSGWHVLGRRMPLSTTSSSRMRGEESQLVKGFR